MDQAAKLALMEVGLLRAADQVGDITRPCLALYYSRFPEAEQCFERLALGDKEKLEQGMVETALYCLMTWLESPFQIEILLAQSVDHHRHTLDIPVDCFSGLIEAAADVIAKVIPPANLEELALWREMRGDLAGVIAGTAHCGRRTIAA